MQPESQPSQPRNQEAQPRDIDLPEALPETPAANPLLDATLPDLTIKEIVLHAHEEEQKLPTTNEPQKQTQETATEDKDPPKQEGSHEMATLPERGGIFAACRNAFDYLRKEHPGLALKRLLVTIPSAAQPVAMAILTGGFIDSIAAGASSAATMWGAALIGLPFIINQIQTLRGSYEGRLHNRTFMGEKKIFVDQVQRLSFGDLQDKEKQKEVERLRANHGRFSDFVDSLYNIAGSKVAVVFALGVMANINLPVTLLICAGAVPMLYLEHRRAQMVESIQKRSTKFHQRLWPLFFSSTNKDISVQLKVMNKSAWAVDRIDKLTGRINRMDDLYHKAGLKLSGIANMINGALSLGAGAWIVHQATNGAMSTGDMFKFWGALGALQLALNSITQLWGRMAQNAPFVNGYFGISGSNPYRDSTTDQEKEARIAQFRELLRTNPVAIHIKDLTFDRGEKRILTIDNLTIQPKSFTGIVGIRGAGKSTLINLLLGVHRPTTGSIELEVGLDRFNLNDIPLEAWHGYMGYTEQDAYQGYSLTVQQSIGLGLHEDDEHPFSLQEAMEITGAASVISAQDAHRTSIGDELPHGRKFSGGELQLFANTRAVIGNRPMMIFDEPTAHLDATSEANLIKSIGDFKAEKTILLISHRFNTFRDVDQIIVLKKTNEGTGGGRIEQIGSHEELMKDPDGTYAQLYNAQVDGLER